jgi:putative endonuclease
MEQSTTARNRSGASAAHTALGRFGEEVAARWLEDQGYQVVDRNWRGTGG